MFVGDLGPNLRFFHGLQRFFDVSNKLVVMRRNFLLQTGLTIGFQRFDPCKCEKFGSKQNLCFWDENSKLIFQTKIKIFEYGK